MRSVLQSCLCGRLAAVRKLVSQHELNRIVGFVLCLTGSVRGMDVRDPNGRLDRFRL